MTPSVFLFHKHILIFNLNDLNLPLELPGDCIFLTGTDGTVMNHTPFGHNVFFNKLINMAIVCSLLKYLIFSTKYTSIASPAKSDNVCLKTCNTYFN